MIPERSANGYIREKLAYRPDAELRTINTIENEYWSLLLFYANVPEEGHKLINTSSLNLRKRSYLTFSALIKIAKTYYDSASTLHHRAASLNYYYCFLNLAKAAIICNSPLLYNEKFVHGLTSRHSDKNNLFDQTSQVFVGPSRDGYNAFDQLYLLSVGTQLRHKSYLKLGNLLRYCSEATYQNTLASGLPSKQLDGYFCVRTGYADDGTGAYWPLIGLYGGNRLAQYPGMHNKLLAKFSPITLNSHAAREIFGLTATQNSMLNYYQSKDTFPLSGGLEFSYGESSRLIQSALGSYLYPQYYDDGPDFKLTLPLGRRQLSPINEMLSIYVITHHLSELVRYKPQYLESLLMSKEAWVLESILDTAASMFLRGLVPLITKVEYRILSR